MGVLSNIDIVKEVLKGSTLFNGTAKVGDIVRECCEIDRYVDDAYHKGVREDVGGLAVQGYDIQVRYEDDGSRDSGIWEAFLDDEGISFLPIPMKKNRTKLTKAMFEKMTGWRKATNEHSRDAAMLVYGL